MVKKRKRLSLKGIRKNASKIKVSSSTSPSPSIDTMYSPSDMKMVTSSLFEIDNKPIGEEINEDCRPTNDNASDEEIHSFDDTESSISEFDIAALDDDEEDSDSTLSTLSKECSDYDSNMDNEKCNSPSTMIQEIQDALLPLKEHLGSTIGGNNSLSRQSTIVNRLALLLSWLSVSLGYVIHRDNTISLLGLFIQTHYRLLEPYCTYLTSERGLSPSSILNHLSDIMTGAKWHAYFANVDVVTTPSILHPLMTIVSALRANLNTALKNTRSARTIEREIMHRRMPINGFADLIAVVQRLLPWAVSLGDSAFSDLAIFRKFMRLLLASMYTSHPQGRISGIASLKYRQGHDLLRDGYAVTDVFKTWRKYGYQVVAIEGPSRQLFQIYFTKARVAIEALYSITPNDDDPLWLNVKGEAEDRISRQIVAFFRENSRLHITSTTLR